MDFSVIVIGIDGAPHWLLKHFLKHNLLPTFKELVDRGAFGRLISSQPPSSPPAWAAATTGCLPGKSGVPDFVFIDPASGQPRLASDTDILSPRFWELLGLEGIQSVVVNIPTTHPAQPTAKALIAGLGARRSDPASWLHPPTLLESINDVAPDFSPTPFERVPRWAKGNYAGALKFLQNRALQEIELMKWALQNLPADVFMGVISSTDVFQHQFLGLSNVSEDHSDDNPILWVFKLADRFLEWLLDRIDPQTNLLIVSDHGQVPARGELRPDVLLENNGWLRRSSRPLTRSTRLVARIPRPARKLLRSIARFLLPQKVISETVTSVGLGDADLQHSLAVAPYSHIYLVAREHFPQASASLSELQQLRSEIVAALYALRDDDGQQVVQNVLCGQETYHGPFVDRCPDILSEASGWEVKEGYSIQASSVLDAMCRKSPLHMPRTGTHHPDGIAIALGPKFKAGLSFEASIVDVAPTILALLDFIPPNDWDGRPLPPTIAQPSRAVATETVGQRHHIIQEQDQTDIHRRLRELGYL